MKIVRSMNIMVDFEMLKDIFSKQDSAGVMNKQIRGQKHNHLMILVSYLEL